MCRDVVVLMKLLEFVEGGGGEGFRRWPLSGGRYRGDLRGYRVLCAL